MARTGSLGPEERPPPPAPPSPRPPSPPPPPPPLPPHDRGRPSRRRGRLFDPRQDSPPPVAQGETLQPDLGFGPLLVAALAEDLHRAAEVDIVHLTGLDLSVGGEVEGALGGIFRHNNNPPSGSEVSPILPDGWRKVKEAPALEAAARLRRLPSMARLRAFSSRGGSPRHPR